MAAAPIEAPTPTRKKAIAAQHPKSPPGKLAATASTASYPGQSAESMKREQDYQTEDDVRTLHRAHQIKTDPTRHMRAKNHIRTMLKAVGRPKAPADEADTAGGPDSEMPQG